MPKVLPRPVLSAHDQLKLVVLRDILHQHFGLISAPGMLTPHQTAHVLYVATIFRPHSLWLPAVPPYFRRLFKSADSSSRKTFLSEE